MREEAKQAKEKEAIAHYNRTMEKSIKWTYTGLT
jgi:hypothetical protein